MDGSGIEDLFSKKDFENLLKAISHSPTKQFAHVSNSFYMKCSDTNKGLKRIVANHLYENVESFSKKDLEKETINNFQNVLNFCENSDWFSL